MKTVANLAIHNCLRTTRINVHQELPRRTLTQADKSRPSKANKRWVHLRLPNTVHRQKTPQRKSLLKVEEVYGLNQLFLSRRLKSSTFTGKKYRVRCNVEYTYISVPIAPPTAI